ncbi:MAG: glucose 1-dehydrogenase [Acetobacteraceae bacterium]|jgi:NAD(P)-dependent dehydrogenase (short-subunit alcohol dehydrogenase family)|nr:glucose 1-dehydrogenase [Acetobacteraceae bacterium]
MGQLEGKAAIVTGGASGIGAACARTMAREGARVLITDLDPAGEGLAGEIGGLFLRHDVTDEAGWPGVIQAAEERFGGLHVMVANAGIGVMATIVEMSLADWRRQMAVNVDGVFLSVKHAIPAMERAGGGSIIIMSSVAGLRGSAGLAGYSATKGAVRLFAKSAALECAQAGNRVRVNSVHPGVIDTPIWDKLPTGGNAKFDPNAIAAEQVPIGEAGQPEDIANGVLYLASDAARHVTGSELVIDGGMTAGRVRRFAH